MFDVSIIGSGPAGYTAAIYAQRAGLKVKMIGGYHIGGQLMYTTHVDNYPGTPNITGPNLMMNMKKQLEDLGVEVYMEEVENIKVISNKEISLELSSNEIINTRTVVIATGSSPRMLDIPNIKNFMNKGISTCAVCDGAFYKNKDVAVIGGGNTAVEEAIYLSNICNKVYLIHRRDEFRAEKILQKVLYKKNNIELVYWSELKEVYGDEKGRVNQIKVFNNKTEEFKSIDLEAVFIAIGHIPNTQLVKELVDLDKYGYIITNSTKTNISNIFAAGDVQDYKYRQAVTAAASGCQAALEIERYLQAL